MTAPRETPSRHLTDEELFGLALPPAGEPEALPPHLLECLRCGRALQEWKTAVRQLADEDVEPVRRRSAGEWRAAEDRTLDAIRNARLRRRPLRPVVWAAAAAAALLLVALLLPATRAPQRSAAAGGPAAELSDEDAADDALLRDVARLSRGEDGGDWTSLAPDPAGVEAPEDAS
jgi:hypothetical protein